MLTARALAIGILGALFTVPLVSAQDFSHYRDFALGSDLAAVATLAGMKDSDAKTVYQRPAVMQDLEWRPSRWSAGTNEVSTDPVAQILFGFYNAQLFRIVVDYGYDRTEGMTDADMIAALSAVYGAPVKRAPGAVRAVSRLETESGLPLGRWGDAGHTVVLYRAASYRAAFRVIVTDLALDDLARKAVAQSARLDEQDAPRREVDRQKKEKDAAQAAAEKARVANKAVFRP